MAKKNESSRIIIRPATPEDDKAVADLIFMTGQEMFTYCFSHEKEKTLKILRLLFRMNVSEFSYAYADVAEIDNNIGGMIIWFDHAVRTAIHKKEMGMGSKIIGTMGFFAFIKRLPRFYWAKKVVLPVDNETIYIPHLATFPKFRGQGIASRLLTYSEEQAKQQHCKHLALDVETDNAAAIRLYERVGFKKLQKVESTRLYQAFGFQGVYRMIKQI
jgi:GNAT superfamily N-acetyltransferase